MARSGAQSGAQQAILGKKAWVETYQSSGVFKGMEEVITDKNQRFPTEGKPIVVRRDLKDYNGSLSQKVFMIGKLTGELVEGDDTLKGKEQQIDQYTQTVSVKQGRKAVATAGREDEKSSPIKLFPQFKPLLSDFIKNYKARDYIRKLAGATTKTFANTPTAATTNRVVYGGDATSTATIEVADILKPNLVKKCATLAENETINGTDGNDVPPIAKINMGDGMFWLLLVHPDVYDDMLTGSNVQQILREAAAYQKDNPLMNAGDLVFYETIVRKAQQLRETSVGHFTTWGSGGATAGATGLFLGAAALACSECDDARYISDTDDYENIKGLAVRNIWGCQKAIYNGEDLGMIAVKTARVGL